MIEPLTPGETAHSNSEPNHSNSEPNADSVRNASIQPAPEKKPSVATVQTTQVTNQVSGKTPLRISLKRKKEPDSAIPTAQKESENVTLNNPFTQDELNTHWAEFAKNTKDSYARSVFQYCRPVLKEDFLIEMSAIGPEQERRFREELPSIRTFLSERLHNDQISFEILLVEDSSSELPFTNKEKFEYLSKKNPALELLVKEFNLRLD